VKQKMGSNNICKHTNSEERTISQNDGNRIGKHKPSSLLEHLETLIQFKGQSDIGEQKKGIYGLKIDTRTEKGRHAFVSNMFQA
jgi:hypothetical protein